MVNYLAESTLALLTPLIELGRTNPQTHFLGVEHQERRIGNGALTLDLHGRLFRKKIWVDQSKSSSAIATKEYEARHGDRNILFLFVPSLGLDSRCIIGCQHADGEKSREVWLKQCHLHHPEKSSP